ncbi:MAG TPA: ABC transporter permease [Lacibacter sp.]|nr:ABC transporter permease [Lacibacter sp.]HMO88385.1 ABC transporter permease [Lacibacter sp.]
MKTGFKASGPALHPSLACLPLSSYFYPVQPTTTHNRSAFLRRLLRNRGAGFGMVVIAAAFLSALFAYALAPDHTPDANRILVELAARKPGFRQQFYLQPKPGTTPAGNWLQGRRDAVTYIPVQSWARQGDNLLLQRYVDEGVTESLLVPLHGQEPAALLTHKTFWLGTDKFGRDILSRLLIGTRVSLGVGAVAVLLSLTIGIFLGALAGYYRGRTDALVMWLVNVVWSMPTLLLVFGITLALGKGYWQVFFAVGLTLWVNVARLVRGQVLALRELSYVEAARAMGFSQARIIIRHILPNILGPVLVIAAGNFATAIVIEAGLSFLGLGVQPPQPSWGLMMKEHYNFIITNNPVLALAPGLAIMLLVLAFNLLGNGLRDALDVRG